MSMPELTSLRNSKNNSRLISIAFGLLLLIILSLVIPITPAAASPDEAKWSKVNIPTEGSAGNWVLADGSDVQHLTMSADGTLYAYANPPGTACTLFKSTDSGYSWSYTGKVTDSIVGIATTPDDASIVYYATTSNVYKSTNAGVKFNEMPSNPGGAGSNNIEITSIAVGRINGKSLVAVSTRDTDNSQYGGIYILDEEEVVPGWTDTGIGNYDAYTVAASPNFALDQQFIAVVNDESNTFVTTKIADGDWGDIIGEATVLIVNITSADIAFPADYDATAEDQVLFVAIDTSSGNGDVYRIDSAAAPGNSIATDLDIGSAYGLSNVDITALAIDGDTSTANLLAGAADSAQVYFSDDGGKNWERSTKPPTGQSRTCLLMAADFIESGRAYAATTGSESAVSITQDGGATWNQIGLIDTAIGTGNIIDLSISPSYSQDSTLFMLTFGGEHSLWQSLSGGARWERVFSSALPDVDTLSLVELSSQFGNGSEVVFLAGTGNGNPVLWQSANNGKTFKRRNAPFTIDAWAVVNDETLFIGCYDGSDGLIYYTTNSGWTYSDGTVVGNQSLHSIALSPNYEEDKTILAGNSNGWVYWSDDNGVSFESLPPDATSPPLTDYATVAFDTEFRDNNTVYAASDTADSGTYRLTINKDTAWESIDSTLPSGGKVNQLAVSADGILYAANLKADGGMERCLDPTYALGPTFETVTRGLSDGATLSGLWLSGNRLWAIDTTATTLMTFMDSLSLPISLTSPYNEAPGTGTTISPTKVTNISLDWETLGGASEYRWQLDYDTDFSTVPDGFEGTTRASSVRLPVLEPATTYYWRVRASEPVLSPWSSKWSFTTSFGTEAMAPTLSSPEGGANNVTSRPIFQWSTIAGADSYELVVSTDASFGNPTIVKTAEYALPSTAWQCNINLNYNTTYYWKVRAISSNTQSAWSAVSAFTTESLHALESSSPAVEPLPPAPPPPPSPPSSTQQVIPEWVIYLVGALILTIILLLIIMLVLVVGIRQR